MCFYLVLCDCCRKAVASEEYAKRQKKAIDLAKKVEEDEAENIGVGALEHKVNHLGDYIKRAINARSSYLDRMTDNLVYAKASQAQIVR
jgi:hypothetical protein